MAFVEIRTQDKWHNLVGELDPQRLLLRVKVGRELFIADLLDYIANPEKYGDEIPAVKMLVNKAVENGRRT